MSETYFDICDTAFKRDDDTGFITILRVDDSGNVYEDEPTRYEYSKFLRNNLDSSVLSKRIAYELARDPGLSYDDPLAE